MNRTLPMSRQGTEVRPVPMPDRQRRLALLRLLRLASVAGLRLYAALSRTPEGHLRSVHWWLLALTFAVPAYAPFLMPIRREHFDFFTLPLGCAWAAALCVIHALATWAKSSTDQGDEE